MTVLNEVYIMQLNTTVKQLSTVSVDDHKCGAKHNVIIISSPVHSLWVPTHPPPPTSRNHTLWQFSHVHCLVPSSFQNGKHLILHLPELNITGRKITTLLQFTSNRAFHEHEKERFKGFAMAAQWFKGFVMTAIKVQGFCDDVNNDPRVLPWQHND